MAKAKETSLKELASSFGNTGLKAYEAAALVIKYFIHVRLHMAVEFLGTKALDPEVFQSYILSKAPEGVHAQELHIAEKTLHILARDKFGKASFELLSAEDKVKAVDAALKELAGTSVFHRNEVGNPVIWDYQVRGHLKAMADSFRRVQGVNAKANGTKDPETGKTKKGKEELYGLNWPAAGKKQVDLSVFVFPRLIPLSVNETGICERPLRAEVFDSKLQFKVERVTLARSETVPPGTSMEFLIGITEASPFSLQHVAKMLDYGYCHGYGQWRNSGKGAFTWSCLGIYEDLSTEEAAALVTR
jgi:hypothetical protein